MREGRGVALLAALALLVVIAGLALLLVGRTIAEVRHGADDTGVIQSLLLARGAANLGGAVLQGPGREELDAIVRATSNPSGRFAYGSGAGAEPTPLSVAQALTDGANSVAGRLQRALDALLCSATIPTLPDGERLALRIHVTATACGRPLAAQVQLPAARFVRGSPRALGAGPGEQVYAIPFAIVAEGRVGAYVRNVLVTGEFQFSVGRTSFASYALFSGSHQTGGSFGDSFVWFNDQTLFDGPVHTNHFLRFYRNPWFGGAVTSAGCSNPGATRCDGVFDRYGAEFHGVGFRRDTQMSPPTSPRFTSSSGSHAPELTAGVDWRASFVPLPASAGGQRVAASEGGITYPSGLLSLQLAATDAAGNPPTPGTPALYQSIRACFATRVGFVDAHRCETHRYRADLRLERRVVTYRAFDGAVISQDADFVPLDREFNGVLFVDGAIERLYGPPRVAGVAPPAVAEFAQLTVASEGFARITGDLRYERPPCSGVPVRTAAGVTPAVCDDLGARNVLGVYAQGGSVRIGNGNPVTTARPYLGSLDAPNDLVIHGVLMSATAGVTVDNYGSGAPRGTINLIGGLVGRYYGAFGVFDTSTGAITSGFGRSTTFDRRMATGVAPPYFPVVEEDTVRNVVALAFAQREQVEGAR
jgi:hypothetical protein